MKNNHNCRTTNLILSDVYNYMRLNFKLIKNKKLTIIKLINKNGVASSRILVKSELFASVKKVRRGDIRLVINKLRAK